MQKILVLSGLKMGLAYMFIISGCQLHQNCAGPSLLRKIEKAPSPEISACLQRVQNIDYQDAEGNSALSLAIVRGDKAIFQQVIAAGPDPLISAPGDVSLALLAEEHQNPIVPPLKKYQLTYWRNLDNPFTQDNLRICIEQDNTLILQEFINRGVRMDSVVFSGISPIALAALNGSTEVMKLFVNLGIDPDSEFDTRSILSIAAMFGYAEMAKILIDAGADINNYEGAHTTALMFAAENNHEPVVRILLDAGANANFYDKNGETALDKATKKGYTKIINLLIKHSSQRYGSSSCHSADFLKFYN